MNTKETKETKATKVTKVTKDTKHQLSESGLKECRAFCLSFRLYLCVLRDLRVHPVFGLAFGSKLLRRDSQHPPNMRREMALMRESGGQCDFAYSHSAFAQEFCCAIDAAADYILMDRHSYGTAEKNFAV